MKMKKKQNSNAVITSFLAGNHGSFNKIIGIYLAACLICVMTILFVFNELIENHDEKIAGQMCNLIAEKINNSIRYMTGSVENLATVMSEYDLENMEQVYLQMKNSVESSDYISIGFVCADGTVYAQDEEKEEFVKWDLMDHSEPSNHVVFSEPFRSSLTGQLVFAMFSPVYQDGEFFGDFYLTYPLEEIEEMAYTKAFKEDTEIWLMDAYSDNIIRCSGNNVFQKGSWSNLKLDKKRIKEFSEYRAWEDLMRSKEESAALTYTIDGISYTQVFESIDFMEGWSVVVRVKSSALSGALSLFRWATVLFSLTLVLASGILLMLSHRRESMEKKLFANLSIYDPLTNVINRRAFEYSAAEAVKGNERCTGALMFFDVDYFKQVNDKYGHDAGDFILVEFAKLLMKHFGECGLVSRYGGDEFVVLVKGLSRSDVDKRVEQLRAGCCQVKLTEEQCPNHDFELHFSCGIAAYPEHSKDFRELTKCADNALYSVKKNGRNGYGWYDANHE